MADNSLDDFFAKKDKSKKKSKSKITPDDSATPAEAIGATDKPKKPKKKKSKQKQTEDNEAGGATKKPEEIEWVDFEDETEKDYTGLRIQNLQISEKQEESSEKEETETHSDEEEGEEGERREKGEQGPWNKSDQPQKKREAPPEPVKPKEEAAPSPAPAPAKASGKYVPPGMRNRDPNATVGGPMGSSHAPRRKKVAPNLKSVEDFPTLGGAPGGDDYGDSERNFERVRMGSKMEDNRGVRGPAKLELGNKYAALRTDN